jgi:hypothetical protein
MAQITLNSTGVASSGALALQSNGTTTAVTIDTSQNVGIGAASPAQKLQVGGGIYISGSATLGTAMAATLSYESAVSRYYIGDGTGYSWAFSKRSASTTTDLVTITDAGNLLVGGTSSSGRLTVYPASNAQYGAWISSQFAGDVGNAMLVLAKYDNNTTTSQIFAQFRVNSSTLSGYITANGANAATFTSSSDARLKENIKKLPSQLDNICKLNPVEFDFKDGSGHQIGFIAQEMQEVYPDSVAEGPDKYLMISGWSKTEARLVKAIQEQQEQINQLKAEVAALKGASA